ncbi:hypothetical protein ACFLZL_01525 [Thermodesulfobacteriota bacterium]
MNDQEALEQIGIVTDWLNSPLCEHGRVFEGEGNTNFAERMKQAEQYLEKRLTGDMTLENAPVTFAGATIETINIYNTQ